MSTVFISYRQTDDAQRQRVRTFAECLRDCDVDVVLDQFFLDDVKARRAALREAGASVGSLKNAFKK